jgi:hypothetical protein
MKERGKKKIHIPKALRTDGPRDKAALGARDRYETAASVP